MGTQHQFILMLMWGLCRGWIISTRQRVIKTGGQLRSRTIARHSPIGPSSTRKLSSTVRLQQTYVAAQSSRTESGSSRKAKRKQKKKSSSARKNRSHPRNSFQGSYDMDRLSSAYPMLSEFLFDSPIPIRESLNTPENTVDDFLITRQTIAFDNPLAVRTLNAALLAADHNIISWQEHLPLHSLTPAIPGRADYIHMAADVLLESSSSDNNTSKDLPTGSRVRCMDIGTGASLIYPLLGTSLYGWSFIGTDINAESLQSAQAIVQANPHVSHLMELRPQKKRSRILAGILSPDETVDVCVCNPPYYESREAFERESARKVRNLAAVRRKHAMASGAQRTDSTSSTITPSGASNNFGGMASELWYTGGEMAFVTTMIDESRKMARQCLWFSCLISRRDRLPRLQARLQDRPPGGPNSLSAELVLDTRVVTMGQGHKSAAVLFWSFHNRDDQRKWCQKRGF